MSQLAFSAHWNPEEAGSNTNEGMDVVARIGQEGKDLTASLFQVLPAKCVAQSKGVSNHLKIPNKGVFS